MKLHSGTHSGTRFHLEKISVFQKNDIIRKKWKNFRRKNLIIELRFS